MKEFGEKIPYQELILARLGEIALKGNNRNKFEQQLMTNIRWRIKPYGQFEVKQRQSRIWIRRKKIEAHLDMLEILPKVTEVFGLVSVSLVRALEADFEKLKTALLQYAAEVFSSYGACTFKIQAKRRNKAFPLTSDVLNAELGALLLEHFSEQLTVDVHQPDVTFYVEVSDDIFLYHEVIPGHKGLPVGMSGRGMLLLSGGIDSPVAGYRMASRGMQLEAIYFHTFPYTSDQAKQKVIDLAKIVSRYAGRIYLHIVDFTSIQLELNDKVPGDMMTIVMRRMMMRIADRLATLRKCKCLITGESLGQVASQTLEALLTTDEVSKKPVFRPLIGIDKDETIRLARKIDTYETSIQPYEDCCTIFVAKHPKTHPALIHAIDAEKKLDVQKLVLAGVEAIDCQIIDKDI